MLVISPETVVRCSVTSIKFQVLDDRSKGRMVARFEVYFKNSDDSNAPEERKAFMASAVINCLWVDAKNNSVKSYMTINPENRALAVLVKLCSIFKVVKCPDDMQINSTGESLRYGPAANKNVELNGEDSATVYYYDSAAQALAAIVKQIQSYKQVSGIAAINLGLVESHILNEIGFEKVGDIFGRGPDMWAGDPGKFLEARDGWKHTSFDAAKNNGIDLLNGITKSLSRFTPSEPQEIHTVNNIAISPATSA